MHLLTLTLAALCLATGTQAGGGPSAASVLTSVTKDSTVTLTCTAASGGSTFSFKKANSPFTGATGMTISAGVLTIDTNTATGYDVAYTCQETGDLESTAVTVGSVAKPSLAKVEGNTDVTLTCSSTDSPAPTFSFTKNDDAITDGNGLTTTGANTVVTITSDKVSEHAGSYRCGASNNGVTEFSDAEQVGSSATRVITTGFVMYLCLHATIFL